ncbi:hypothetical protein VB264_21225 [Arcicella aquatica]|uniref:Uncharacterized protein n=1 Tax=Arcicella aquatica TaxID=217141 RepID=A0ABU5QUF6_9BACT|nr:hypothetical protein [Arcicella aquatica]MEA5260335.1 hypothetical protein [Arcicella aquatica]
MSLLKTSLSTHLFLFPFRWDIINVDKSFQGSSYGERTLLSGLDEGFSFEKLLLSNPYWKRSPFDSSENYLAYNQYHYFYEFVRTALFDNEEYLDSGSPMIRTFTYGQNEKLRYKISVHHEEGIKVYDLGIDKIQLNAYDVGVGILSFHLSSDEETLKLCDKFDSSDVLLINDFGRRLYPQFLSDGFNINKTQEEFLSKSIHIEGSTFNIKSDFINDYQNKPDYLPQHIIDILGKNIFTNNFEINSIASIPTIKIHPLIDDRMFVLSWLGDDAEIKAVQTYNKESIYYPTFDFWQKFVFIDGKDITCPDFTFAQGLLSKVTYTRWLPYSTLFGISRYSFVILTSISEFSTDIIKPQLGSLYFQMVQLILLQRASLLRFSSELTRITHKIEIYEREGSNKFEKIADDVRILYKNYILFRNQLYFREVTAQEQGIELYNMMQETMRIETQIKELDAEIEELHRYVKMVNDEFSSEYLSRLDKMAGAFGVFSLLMSYFSYGLLNFPKYDLSISETFIVFILIAVTLLVVVGYFHPKWLDAYGKYAKHKKTVSRVLGLLGLSFLFVPLLLKLNLDLKPEKSSIDSLKHSEEINRLKIDSLRLEIKKLILANKPLAKPNNDSKNK